MTPEETAAHLERLRQEGAVERDRVAFAWRLATFFADRHSAGRLGSGSSMPCEGHAGPAPLMLTLVEGTDGRSRRLCWHCVTRTLIEAGAWASEASRIRTRAG